ncbi:hypothetical protein SCUCBS95973_000828 [Sporothrix curviconia]|uniref:Uncharacterized protein n=1 Tax=Sporothrix curviconia TaxID=1260050 RepID=A0ABP0ATH0_9PEZI
MSTLSFFTGHMALSATASASETLTQTAPELTTTTPTTPTTTTTAAAAAAAKTLLTTPQTEALSPSTSSSPPAHHNYSMSLRSPTAALVYRCHKSATRAWTLAAAAAHPVVWLLHQIARLLLLVGAALAAAAQVVLLHSWQALCWACWWHLWACPPATRLRKKLYFELALVMMGPSGNGLLLVVLWPGWLVLAAGIWGVSAVAAGV